MNDVVKTLLRSEVIFVFCYVTRLIFKTIVAFRILKTKNADSKVVKYVTDMMCKNNSFKHFFKK